MCVYVYVYIYINSYLGRLVSLAIAAKDHNLTRPKMTDGTELLIEGGYPTNMYTFFNLILRLIHKNQRNASKRKD